MRLFSIEILPVLSLVLGVGLCAQFQAKVDPALPASFEGLKTIMVHLKDNSELKSTILNLDYHEKSGIEMDPERRDERVGLVTKTLMEVHSEAQVEVLSFLKERKTKDGKSGVKGASELEITPLWITNTVIVKNADSELVEELASRSDVQSIEADKIHQFDDPIEPTSGEASLKGPNDAIQWGILTVDAPAVWKTGNKGEGIVVGVTDTGVNGKHEALRNNYRSENGWLDPSTQTTEPNDMQGHGTHCAGSILGQTQGIGVAPNAKWIACRGCTSSGCSGADLAMCGQFMLCPSGNNNSCMAPQIVSNSWGSQNFLGFDGSYDRIIAAWRAAGIIPVFALGNSGRRGCRSTGNPGDNPDVIGIGASANDSTMADFSSLGPTKKMIILKGQIKPDFSAPGKDIYSAAHNSDNGYTTMSGTSMATPHAAGVIALMMSAQLRQKNQILKYEDIYSALINGTMPHKQVGTRLFQNCGQISESTYPNNHAGYGIMNATKAIMNLPK